MKLPFDTIFSAFEELLLGEPYSVSVLMHSETGQSYFVYDDDDMNEDNPEDLFENEIYFSLPDPSDLCHGRELAFRFASAEVRDHADKIYEIFERRGAFGRFKALLADIGKLQDWYDFEQKVQREELREWCEMSEIDFE